ncbi:MAG: DUF3467 domain-containing protein [Desulfobacteraceae bacterium]|nr:MAG: DUF3467 domain-containing protein [Desulfobacteraceae bacterium]
MAQKKKKDAEVVAPTEHEVIFPENFSPVYTNSAFFIMSDRDLLVDFGVRRPELSKGDAMKAPTQVHTRVVMSPQHAKRFLGRLQHVLDAYEKDFGEIHLSPNQKK